MKYLREAFAYNHEEGCLVWKPLNDNVVHIRNGKIQSNVSPMSRVKPGSVAGKQGFGDYKIKQDGVVKCGLRMIWQHVTGEFTMSKIRTMNPRDTRFCIDNLYLVPSDQTRVHKDRAKNSTVVSWSFEHNKFTVVDVDNYYNKTILSYHQNIEDALEALNKPVVSFL